MRAHNLRYYAYPSDTLSSELDLGTLFAYYINRYAQVAVEDFEIGGMENTSCTTLATRISMFSLHLQPTDRLVKMIKSVWNRRVTALAS
jgi:aminopeptidase N